MCASSPYTILPFIQFLCVGQGLRESENTGNPLVINEELSNNSAGLISNLKQKAYSKVKIFVTLKGPRGKGKSNRIYCPQHELRLMPFRIWHTQNWKQVDLCLSDCSPGVVSNSDPCQIITPLSIGRFKPNLYFCVEPAPDMTCTSPKI